MNIYIYIYIYTYIYHKNQICIPNIPDEAYSPGCTKLPKITNVFNFSKRWKKMSFKRMLKQRSNSEQGSYFTY